MTAIVVQVLRGQQSHFNRSSPLNAAVFAGMGVLVVVIFVATVVVGVALLRQATGGDRATTLAVRLGLAISVLGMSVGFLMVGRDAHSVGAPDGGTSVPLVGWSTTAGDLRVPHFIGLHALQVLPLLAIALAATRLTDRSRARLMLVVAGGYLGVFAVSLVQALRGQAVTAPDVWTVLALVTVVLAVVVAGVGVLRAGRSLPETRPAAVPVEVG